jgi:chromate transporter
MQTETNSSVITAITPPHEPYGRLFRRFLHFGFLAWGGPAAQIAMIRQELVEEERWISKEHFNRVLAIYQVLPGPEAHELCVYFGMIARGRLGGLLAGLGFMLPGFILMFLLSWLYVTYGLTTTGFAPAFYGIQPAVIALIVRAVHRIGSHVITDRWLLAITLVAGMAQFFGLGFWLTLPLAGLAYVFARRKQYALALILGVVLLGAALVFASNLTASQTIILAADGTRPSVFTLFGSGLKSGLLTFGGAYTVIPFLRADAVGSGGWMSDSQFLDGLALSGILPAPLIIFSTFVGYLGGGAVGAVLLTIGIFLPAFLFTLVGHNFLERLISNPSLHTFLEGVTAGVVGLIAATSVVLLRTVITDWRSLVVFALALAVLYVWKAKFAVAGVVLGAGVLGFLLFR